MRASTSPIKQFCNAYFPVTGVFTANDLRKELVRQCVSVPFKVGEDTLHDFAESTAQNSTSSEHILLFFHLDENV